MRTINKCGYTEAKLREKQNALYGVTPPIPPTIIRVQDLAQAFLEDEVLMFEVQLLNNKEELNQDSEIVLNINGYLSSCTDDFEVHDYSQIRKDIEKYIDGTDVDYSSVYFKLLEKRFAKARLDSLIAMLDLCNDINFIYKTNKEDLNIDINNFKISNTIQKLVAKSKHKKQETLYIQEAVYKLAETIKTEFKNQNIKLNKGRLAGEILNRINNKKYDNKTVIDANLSEANIKRKYLDHWKDI